MGYKNIWAIRHIYVAFFLFLLGIGLNAQESQLEKESFCNSMTLQANQKIPEDFTKPKSFRNQLRSVNTWNLNDGYGSSCIHDCIFDAPISCSLPSKSVYSIPVVFTVSNTSGCGNNVPTQQNVDAMLAITNDYFACQGVPIRFYKSVNYPGHPTTGDMSTRFLNLGCTFNENNVVNVPNRLNIYIFHNTGFGTGCNGFAYLPTGPSAPNLAVMSRSCFNNYSYNPGSINCSSPSLGASYVLIHELGHNLGLHHTHNENNTNECPNGTNACTAGDYFQDTNADPGLHRSCVTGTTCNRNPSGCTSPCATPYPTSINTFNNIMSYNSSNCCITFTTCQKAKMVDALLCARGLQMCDRNINEEFAGGASDITKTICIGNPAPTFSATSNCYNWYSALGENATLLLSGSSTFTPTLGTGNGQLNNNVPGTYRWYLGDINEINPECRTQITVIVSPLTGVPTVNGQNNFISSNCSSNSNAALTTNATSLLPNQVIGWWIREDNPVNNVVNNNTTLNTALNAAQIDVVPITNPVNHLIKSTSGTPLKNLTLGFNCGNLNKEKNYYATPVLANYRTAIPDATCNGTQSNQTNVTINGFPGKSRRIPPANIPCVPNPVNNPPTYTFNVNITGYTGGTNQLGMWIKSNGFNGDDLFFTFTAAGNGNYPFTHNSFPGYDPGNPGGSDGITVMVWHQGGQGMLNGTITLTLNITYPGLPELPFPSITSYSDCLFGAALPLNCSCNCLPSASIINPVDYSCPLTAVNLSALPTGNYQYLWNNNATTSQISISPASTSIYTVTVTHNVVNCVSQNSTTVTVEGTTITNQNNNGLGSLRSIANCLPSNGGNITFNTALADTVFLTQPLLLNKDININGSSGGLIHLDFTASGFMNSLYGLQIAPNKTVQFNNIAIEQYKNLYNTIPIISNFGSLTLNSAILKGNVQPLYSNEAGSTVQINQLVEIIKN